MFSKLSQDRSAPSATCRPAGGVGDAAVNQTVLAPQNLLCRGRQMTEWPLPCQKPQLGGGEDGHRSGFSGRLVGGAAGRGPGPGALEGPACGPARRRAQGPLSPALGDLQDSTRGHAGRVWKQEWHCVSSGSVWQQTRWRKSWLSECLGSLGGREVLGTRQ